MKTRNEKVRLIESREWYHSIEIEEGLVTPGRLALPDLKQVLTNLDLPESFEGLSVLDIGAWDGFYSFEAEKRGAKRVVAFDLNPPDHYGFSVARELLNSRVEFVQGSVYDLSPEIHGTFDIVFFLGVFYHLRYPLLALDRIREITQRYCLIETNCMDSRLILGDMSSVRLADVDKRLEQIPLYRFLRYDELNPGDFSNWFSPNRRAIEDALWTSGFRPEFLAAWSDRIAFRGVRLHDVPDYLIQTYDGQQWIKQPDGTQSLATFSRGQERQAKPESPSHLPTFTIPTRVTIGSELTQEEEFGRLRSQVIELNRQISQLHSRIGLMQTTLHSIQRSRVYGLIRLLGLWKWFEQSMAELRSMSNRP